MHDGLDAILGHIRRRPGEPVLVHRFLSVLALVQSPDERMEYLRRLARAVEGPLPAIAQELYRKLAKSPAARSGNTDQTVLLSDLEQSVLESESLRESQSARISARINQAEPSSEALRSAAPFVRSQHVRVMRDQYCWAETFAL